MLFGGDEAMGRRTFLYAVLPALCLALTSQGVAQFTWADDDAVQGEQGYQYIACSNGGNSGMTTAGNSWAPVDRNDYQAGTNAAQIAYQIKAAGAANWIQAEWYNDLAGTAYDFSTGYEYVNFWAISQQEGQLMNFALRDSDGDTSNWVQLTPYVDDHGTGTGLTNAEWRAVTVPLSVLDGALNFDLTKVNRLVFYLDGDDVVTGSMIRLTVDFAYFNGPLAVNWPRD
jgi:hypothetical protein